MAFPRFHGGQELPTWQGRQEKRYFVSGDVGYLIKTTDEGVTPSYGAFIEALQNALTGFPENDALIKALVTQEIQRFSTFPGISCCFSHIAGYDDIDLLKLVKRLNQHFSTLDVTTGGLKISSATVNWLTGAQQSKPVGTGGPGGLPVPAPKPLDVYVTDAVSAVMKQPQDQSATVEAPTSEKITNTNKLSGIKFYVLDTAPNATLIPSKENPDENFAKVELQRQQFGALAEGGTLINLLFGKNNNYKETADRTPYSRVLNWNDQFSIYYDQTPDSVTGKLLMDVLVNEKTNDPAKIKVEIEGGYYLPGHNYDMRDHGLFIASLIAQEYYNCYEKLETGNEQNVASNDLIESSAPPPQIDLIQVLSNFGVGTMECFLRGLAKVIELQAQNTTIPAVVNCSWVLTAPLQLEHLFNLFDCETGLSAAENHFFAELICAKNGLQPHDKDYYENVSYLKGLYALQQMFEDLKKSHNVYIFACAGNDRKLNQTRPSARFPAAFKTVTGVTSLSTRISMGNHIDTTTASYANIADDPSTVGFAIWGGEVDHTQDVIVDDEVINFSAKMNSPVGLYFDDFFPDSVGNKDRSGVDLIDLYLKQQRITFPANFNDPGIRPNTNGLAHWAGTSFATPLAVGVFAANLVRNWNPASDSFKDTEGLMRRSSIDKTLELEPAIPLKQ